MLDQALNYRIMLGLTPNSVELLEDNNKDACRPYDGGRLLRAPESYPAKICAFTYGKPTYAEDDIDENRTPVSYPKDFIGYREVVVHTPDDWLSVRAKYIAGAF